MTCVGEEEKRKEANCKIDTCQRKVLMLMHTCIYEPNERARSKTLYENKIKNMKPQNR